MKFLIPTEPDDTHALYVKLALEQLNHHVRLLFTADSPTKQTNSVYIDNAAYRWHSTDSNNSVADNVYDVVWWRRARKPFLPKESIHPEDYKFVLRENQLFYEAITDNMAPEAWWVNSKNAAFKANSKLLQLNTAVQCGMQIPTTLCSNDPKDIRYFLLKHDQNGVIYKPLCVNYWFDKKQIKIAYTTKIDFLDLPSNHVLQIAPGIFQREVKKQYELRVTCFGNYLVSAKLNSQQHKEGKVDWRAIPEGKLSVEPYQLPSSLENQIRAFMQKMGLVFGCLDFIYDTDGNYIFLEVNEQGQFLWLEDYNPEFKMLDIFTQFLVSKSQDFHWQENNFQHSLAQYTAETVALMQQNMREHVELNSAKAQGC